MTNEFKEIIFIAVPKHYYEVLKLWASERNFRSSSQNFTPDQIAAEIVCEFIDNVERMELKLQSGQTGMQDQVLGPENKGSLPTQA